MYNQILVAIDDSNTSRKALDEAISLAKLHGAKLEIAHAVDETVVQAYSAHGAVLAHSDQLEKALLAGGASVLDEAIETARAAGIEPGRHLLVSDDLHADEQIANAVKKTKADLLVVGSHGRRGVRRLLLGSIAENLMRKVEISVLIVRGHH